jgi:hypothetical protein
LYLHNNNSDLTELKKKPIGELIKIAEFMGLEGMARNRKQDIIFVKDSHKYHPDLLNTNLRQNAKNQNHQREFRERRHQSAN